MKRNLGKFDRLFRVTVSAFLILLVFSNYVLGVWAYLAVVVAIILFVTAVYGTCPLYSLFKISSLKK